MNNFFGFDLAQILETLFTLELLVGSGKEAEGFVGLSRDSEFSYIINFQVRQHSAAATRGE